MTELKPCPFCGNAKLDIAGSEDVFTDDNFSFSIQCNGCGDAMVFEESADSLKAAENLAVKVWNARWSPNTVSLRGDPIEISGTVKVTP